MIPKVSVVTAAYNAEESIQESIESVLSQSYDNIELIVVINGCSDNTESVVRKLEKEDKRVRILFSEKGKVPARNCGFAAARGDVIALNDSDDVWLPGKLSLQMKVLESGFDVVGGRIECVDSSGKVTQDPLERPTSHFSIINSLLNGVNPLANSATIFKRKLFNWIGTYDDCFPFCEDYHFWLRAAKFAKFNNVEDVVMRYFSHPSPGYDPRIPLALASFYKSMYSYTGALRT